MAGLNMCLEDGKRGMQLGTTQMSLLETQEVDSLHNVCDWVAREESPGRLERGQTAKGCTSFAARRRLAWARAHNCECPGWLVVSLHLGFQKLGHQCVLSRIWCTAFLKQSWAGDTP